MSSPWDKLTTVKHTSSVEPYIAVEKLSTNRSVLRPLPTAVDTRALGLASRLQTSDRRVTAGQQPANTFSTPLSDGAPQPKDWRREDLAWNHRRQLTLRSQVISTTTKNSLNR
jgi:hypothetical protein